MNAYGYTDLHDYAGWTARENNHEQMAWQQNAAMQAQLEAAYNQPQSQPPQQNFAQSSGDDSFIGIVILFVALSVAIYKGSVFVIRKIRKISADRKARKEGIVI